MELNFLTFLIFFCACLANKSCFAIDIGGLTSVIQENEEFISKVIMNNTENTQFYRLEAYVIDNPKVIGTESIIRDGQLLFSPKKFSLSSGEKKIIKFYYNGPKDNVERYYKVLFKELAPPSVRDNKITKLGATFYMTVSVEGFIVVRPRMLNFDYSYDKKNSILTNKGNSYFEVIQKNSCTQPDDKSMSRHLLPNESIKIIPPGEIKEIIIVYKNKFISLTDNCVIY